MARSPDRARGDEILAADTYEAVRVVRRPGWHWLGQCGDWVLKFLRPHDAFAGESAEARLRQLRLRVAESRRHPELNPLWFDERANCLVSRFVDGPWASTRQANALLRQTIASGRGYLLDLAPQNLRMTPAGLVAIDFAIDESHADWLTLTPSRRS
jgi:hypothetical protein